MDTPNLRWIENTRAAFVRVYGKARGGAVCRVVMPAVTADFRKTVLAAAEGAPVREEYRTDDRRTAVLLTGRRRGDRCVVEGIAVGGEPVPLGAKELVL